MNKFLKILLIILGSIVSLVVISFLPIWDDASIVDSDLTATIATAVKPADNAYEILPKFSELTTTETNALELINTTAPLADRLGKLTPTQQKKFITDTTGLVEKFKQASAKPAYQCPKLQNVYGRAAEGCDLSTLQKISQVTAIHAYYHGTNGNVSEATKLAESLLKLAHLIQQQEEPGMLIEYLMSMAMKLNAVDIIDAKITQPLVTTKYQIQPVFIENALLREYKDTKAMILEGFGPNAIATYWFQPNQTINDFAKFTRVDIARIVVPCGKTPDMTAATNAFNRIRQPLDLKLLLNQNFKGNLLLNVILAGYGGQGGIRDKACELNTRLSK